jgi:hypothetical protein
MGIRVTCPKCGKQLNVKSFLAGKRGVCPDCRGRFDIPGARNVTLEVDDGDDGTVVSTVSAPNLPEEIAPSAATQANVVQPYAPQPIAPAAFPAASMPVTPQAFFPAASPAVPQAAPYAAHPALGSAGQPFPLPMPASPAAMPAALVAQPVYHATPAAAPDPIAEAAQAQWYVRPPVGGQFGPAAGDVMRQWIQERRVTPDSLVWREGWVDWQRADVVFPALAVASQVAMAVMQPLAGMPTAMPVGMVVGTPSPAGTPWGVDPAANPFPAEEVVRPLAGRNPYKKRSSNRTTVALALLIIALLVLAPLFGYVLMQQLK